MTENNTNIYNYLKTNGFVQISSFFEELEDYYYVNNKGTMISINLYQGGFKILKPWIDKDGYHRYHLQLKDKTQTRMGFRTIGVHKIVNTIFHGYPPLAMKDAVTDHLDGNRANNSIENLRWISNAENASYSYRHNGKKSEIEEHDVWIIYKLFDEGKSLQEIADRYHTGWKYIHGILTGKKRVVAIEKFRLTPYESTKNVLTRKIIKDIAYEIIKENKSGYSVAKEKDINYQTVANIIQGVRHQDKIKYYDFKNKQILYDPDNFINSYDEFIQMDDYYNQFVYETENNEEFDMFADNSNEVIIGYTEYYTDDTWND